MVSFVIDTPENKTAILLNKISTERNKTFNEYLSLCSEYRKVKRGLNIFKAMNIHNRMQVKLSNYYTLGKLHSFVRETLA